MKLLFRLERRSQTGFRILMFPEETKVWLPSLADEEESAQLYGFLRRGLRITTYARYAPITLPNDPGKPIPMHRPIAILSDSESPCVEGMDDLIGFLEVTGINDVGEVEVDSVDESVDSDEIDEAGEDDESNGELGPGSFQGM